MKVQIDFEWLSPAYLHLNSNLLQGSSYQEGNWAISDLLGQFGCQELKRDKRCVDAGNIHARITQTWDKSPPGNGIMTSWHGIMTSWPRWYSNVRYLCELHWCYVTQGNVSVSSLLTHRRFQIQNKTGRAATCSVFATHLFVPLLWKKVLKRAGVKLGGLLQPVSCEPTEI